MTGGGDTPEQKTFKYGIGGSTSNFFAGYYAKGEGEFLDAFCYALTDNPTYFAVFDSNGVMLSNGQPTSSYWEQQVLDKLMAAIDQQVENIYLVPCPVSIGESLTDFDDYLQV